jgi:hypothetical protein
MSLSRKNPKKRGYVKNKKTRSKHTKSRKQMGGHRDSWNIMHSFGNPNRRYGFTRAPASSKDVDKFIKTYKEGPPSSDLYTFFTSKKTLTDNTDVFTKNVTNTKTEHESPDEPPDNIINKMWTDYINELCDKVEKKLDANIKKAAAAAAVAAKAAEAAAAAAAAAAAEAAAAAAEAAAAAAGTKTNVMKHITLLRRLNTPGIWEYLWMDWFPEAVTDEDDHKKSITYSTTIKQYKDIDALNYGNDGNLKLLFPQNTYQVDTKYNNPFDKILHMISTFESSMYAQTLSAAAFGQTPDGDNDAQKWKDINDKSKNASSTILSSTHRVPISKRLIDSNDTSGTV